MDQVFVSRSTMPQIHAPFQLKLVCHGLVSFSGRLPLWILNPILGWIPRAGPHTISPGITDIVYHCTARTVILIKIAIQIAKRARKKTSRKKVVHGITSGMRPQWQWISCDNGHGQAGRSVSWDHLSASSRHVHKLSEQPCLALASWKVSWPCRFVIFFSSFSSSFSRRNNWVLSSARCLCQKQILLADSRASSLHGLERAWGYWVIHERGAEPAHLSLGCKHWVVLLRWVAYMMRLWAVKGELIPWHAISL